MQEKKQEKWAGHVAHVGYRKVNMGFWWKTFA